MNTCKRTVVVGIAMLLIVGCGQKGISTTRLERSFKGTEAQMQANVRAVVKALEAKDYAGAAAALERLGAQAKLTEEQRAAVEDLLEQVRKQIAAAVEEKAEELQKMLGK
ncbi:MAG: hypothetical protein N2595_09895 [bacterium]|nr:hypothetical protein [bacterium]